MNKENLDKFYQKLDKMTEVVDGKKVIRNLGDLISSMTYFLDTDPEAYMRIIYVMYNYYYNKNLNAIENIDSLKNSISKAFNL